MQPEDDGQAEPLPDPVGQSAPEDAAGNAQDPDQAPELPRGCGREAPLLHQVGREEGGIDHVGEAEAGVDRSQDPEAGVREDLAPAGRASRWGGRDSAGPVRVLADLLRPVAKERQHQDPDHAHQGRQEEPRVAPSLGSRPSEDHRDQEAAQHQAQPRSAGLDPGAQPAPVGREPERGKRHGRDVDGAAGQPGEGSGGQRRRESRGQRGGAQADHQAREGDEDQAARRPVRGHQPRE